MADYTSMLSKNNPYSLLLTMLQDSLSGTDEEDILGRLTQESNLARSGANDALRAFTRAQEAPLPEVAPEERFASTLVGNVASVIGQNPAYREGAQEDLKTKHGLLLKQRDETLSRLENAYKLKAGRAEKIGDIELQTKTLEQLKKVGEQRQELLNTLRAGLGEEGATQRAKLARQTDLDVASLGIIREAVGKGLGSYDPATRKFTAFAGGGIAKRTETTSTDFAKAVRLAREDAVKSLQNDKLSDDEKAQAIETVGGTLDDTINAAGVLANERSPIQTLTRLAGITKPTAVVGKGFFGGSLRLSNPSAYDKLSAIHKTIELWGFDDPSNPEAVKGLRNFLLRLGKRGTLTKEEAKQILIQYAGE